MAVTYNEAQALFIIPCEGGGYSCYGYANALREVKALAAELRTLGRFYNTDGADLVTPMDLWAMLVNLQKIAATTGHRFTYNLTPLLNGPEGRRVEATYSDGSKRRFYVGKSMGWAPCHLEIMRSNSRGGGPVSGDVTAVKVLG